MLRITKETKRLRHQAVHDWFDRAGFLKPAAESAFRAANPTKLDNKKRPELNEYKINKFMFKLSTFIKNRKINRRGEVEKLIKSQFAEEMDGIPVSELEWAPDG